MRTFLILLVLVIGGFLAFQHFAKVNQAPLEYDTELVHKQDVVEAVAVTGSAEPVEITVVNSEVPGIVEEVLVDFNDEVLAGQTLATLSSSVQKVQLEQAKAGELGAIAGHAGAEAALKSAMSAVEAAMAGRDAAKRELETAQKNLATGIIEATKFDTVRDLVRKAEAGLTAAEAQVTQAQAGILQAEHLKKTARDAVQLAQLNLDKTVLRSKMTGILLNKNIRVGDAVGVPKVSLTDASSGIFEIASPLDKMRAIVKVNEADYSRVKVGQICTFRVDAYPGEQFTAKVDQIRNATTSDRTAVSYNTVLSFANRRDPNTNEWMVRPRSTVSADIEIRKAKGVLVIPNAALLFTPRDFTIELPAVKEGEQVVWSIASDAKPTPHVVRTGISDGTVSEVLGGDLKEGDRIITGAPIEPERSFHLPFGN